MISLSIHLDGLSELRTAARRETRLLVAETVEAVDAAGKAGKATARVMAPHRSYALRNSIDSDVTNVSANGAEGEIVASANHASMIYDGTKPHPIFPRRKKALRFEAGGGIVFARSVSHPGTAPQPAFWDRAAEVAQRTLDARCEAATDALCARLSA